MPLNQASTVPQGGASAPATDAFVITPNNGSDLAKPARAIYVGTGGSLAVTTVAGNTATFVSVPSGTILPIWVCRVSATGTTASNLLGMV